LSGRQTVLATAATDSQGNFTLSKLASGTYEALVTARGFAPAAERCRFLQATTTSL
jgi:hypothetical protein